jgi:hypothetical protein
MRQKIILIALAIVGGWIAQTVLNAAITIWLGSTPPELVADYFGPSQQWVAELSFKLGIPVVAAVVSLAFLWWHHRRRNALHSVEPKRIEPGFAKPVVSSPSIAASSCPEAARLVGAKSPDNLAHVQLPAPRTVLATSEGEQVVLQEVRMTKTRRINGSKSGSARKRPQSAKARRKFDKSSINEFNDPWWKDGAQLSKDQVKYFRKRASPHGL